MIEFVERAELVDGERCELPRGEGRRILVILLCNERVRAVSQAIFDVN